jgi:hypothetical protein
MNKVATVGQQYASPSWHSLWMGCSHISQRPMHEVSMCVNEGKLRLCKLPAVDTSAALPKASLAVSRLC